MEVFEQAVVWIFSLWERFYFFITEQHPIVQMKVFAPVALLVVSIFISFVGKNERSP